MSSTDDLAFYFRVLSRLLYSPDAFQRAYGLTLLHRLFNAIDEAVVAVHIVDFLEIFP